jgi:hypothetical protein
MFSLRFRNNAYNNEVTWQLSLSWFLSAGWEHTKRGIPSRWFQLKSNDIVIVCWLTISKRTHLSSQNFPLWQFEERGREVKTDCFASFQNFEFWRWKDDGRELCAIGGVDQWMMERGWSETSCTGDVEEFDGWWLRARGGKRKSARERKER